jgi:multiple sugar transport system substrate-binding protein
MQEMTNKTSAFGSLSGADGPIQRWAARDLGRRDFMRAAGVTGLLAGGSLLLAACSPAGGGGGGVTTLPTSAAYTADDATKLNDSLDWGKSAVADPSAAVTITVAHSWTPGDFVRQQQFDYFFQKRHPNISIKAENAGDSSANFLTKYLSQASGGSLPDVMFNGFGFAQTFISAGSFLALDDYIAKEPDFKLDDFTKPSTGYYKAGGKLYSIPYDCGPVMLYYNKDLFDKAGVGYPDASWTLDTLREAAKKLTTGDGPSKVFGIAPQLNPTDGMMDPVRLNPLGGAYLSEDESEVLIDQPDSIAAMQWWADIFLVDGSTPSPAELQAMQSDPFLLGKAAMNINGSWSVPTLRDEATFKWAITDWPAGTKTQSTAAVGSAYSITSKSANQDAAWLYLNEYTSTSGQIFMTASTGKGSMSRNSAWPTYLQSELAPEGAQSIYDALNKYATSDGVVFGSASTAINNAVKPIWDQVLAKSLPVDEACTQIATAIKPLLVKNSA